MVCSAILEHWWKGIRTNHKKGLHPWISLSEGHTWKSFILRWLRHSKRYCGISQSGVIEKDQKCLQSVYILDHKNQGYWILELFANVDRMFSNLKCWWIKLRWLMWVLKTLHTMGYPILLGLECRFWKWSISTQLKNLTQHILYRKF